MFSVMTAIRPLITFIILFRLFIVTTTSAESMTSLNLPLLGEAQAVTAQGQLVPTATVFTGGISVNGTAYQSEVTQTLADAVRIEGNMQVDPTHVNQLADLLVYAKLEASTTANLNSPFYQLDVQNNISLWDQQPANLVAFRQNVILSAQQSVSLYSGTFYFPGLLNIFFGYRLQDGTFVTNTKGMMVTISSKSVSSRFTAAPCPFPIPEDRALTEGTDFSCGYATVPEQHADPEGPQIRLAVAIFHSSNNQAKSDPLLMEQGGPGGSTLETFATSLLTPEDTLVRPLLQRQDIVLIEQRGTLYSEPYLFCEEVKQFQLDLFKRWMFLTNEEIGQRADQALIDCRDRFLNEGINLSAYNSVENAADIAMVINMLGYSQFNYYGVSYGTMLGQHLMRDHRQQLRSVILDSVVPLETSFIPLTANTLDRSFKLLFAKCAADSICTRQYPRLEQVFFDTIDRLNVSPTFISPEDLAGNSYVLPLTGDDVMGQTATLLYSTSLIPLLPAIIYRIARGDYGINTLLFEETVFNDTSADGMFNSVICAEEANYTDADYQTAGLYPAVAEMAKGQDVRATCALWPVNRLEAYVNEPVSSQLPTLILSGEFDPVTPPSFGQTVAQHLPYGYAYTFPGVGHGVIAGGECPQSMMLAFLDSPFFAPPEDCIAKMEIKFAAESGGDLLGGNRLTPVRNFILEDTVGIEALAGRR